MRTPPEKELSEAGFGINEEKREVHYATLEGD
jgi:hypothetical protein